VRAKAINDQMKMAATHALSALAKADVPDGVRRVYGIERMEFGVDYIIPKPFDQRVLTWVAPAVAKAAMESGVAQQVLDIEEYKDQLERRLGKAHEVMRVMIHKAQRKPKRLVFPEGDETKILRAAQILLDERIAQPILLGDPEQIWTMARDLHLHVSGMEVVNPQASPKAEAYAKELYRLRHRKGLTPKAAREAIRDRNLFASMMVRMGDADALVGGLTQHYPETIRPALQVISVRKGLHKVSGVYIAFTQRGQVYFLADCTVNIEPSSEDLAEIAVCTAELARRFDVTPRVALLSFSNFGSTRHPLADKVRRAVDLIRAREPGLIVDGEMQADTAVVPEIMAEDYPFSCLKGGANVLVFPNLESGNIAYKLLARIGGCEVIGPILMGTSKPVHVLQRGAEVNDIINVAAIAVVDAGEREDPQKDGDGQPAAALGVLAEEEVR
jgi:malate dehydrogenase (oxaloacetate-decarboxylating)(NADP+)